MQGTARATPLGSTLRARVSRVDLAFWAPYLDLPLQFNGMIETDLTVDVARRPGRDGEHRDNGRGRVARRHHARARERHA